MNYFDSDNDDNSNTSTTILTMQQTSDGEGEIFFSAEDSKGYVKVLGDGNYTIKYSQDKVGLLRVNEQFKVSPPNALITLAILVCSFTVGVIASFPYATYETNITQVEMVFFCIIRSCVFAFVFSSQWVITIYKLLVRHEYKSNNLGFIRYSLCCVFASLYAIMYTIKWVEMDNILIRKGSVPLFALSWFNVFYNLIDMRLISCMSFSSTSAKMRMRKVLLSCIKIAECITKKSRESCCKVFSHFENIHTIELLVAKQVNSMFYQSKTDVLNVYEEDKYDRCADLRKCFINVCIGFSLVPLFLSIMEDYGYSLFRLCTSENLEIAYYWMTACFCLILSVLYIVATYDIHHRNMTKVWTAFRSKQDMIEAIKNMVFQTIPLMGACIIGTTRVNSSYAIFGKIAAKFDMPISVGLTFIYAMLTIVFIIDAAASYKIICRSYKGLLSIISLSISPWNCTLPGIISSFIKRYTLRYNYKRLKRFIRNCNDATVSAIYEDLA